MSLDYSLIFESNRWQIHPNKDFHFMLSSFILSPLRGSIGISFFGRGSISFHRLPIYPITPMGFRWHAQPRRGAGKLGRWWSMLNGQLAGRTTSRNPCRQTKTNSDFSPSGATEKKPPYNNSQCLKVGIVL